MKANKVIPFERGAEFYFDLSFKHQQRGKLKTALRYIEKAVEVKPYDSSILFSYAGILAELGHLDLSSDILLSIIEDIDPFYEDCYFGLACNFLQLQKLKKSSYYFEKYIKVATDGEFIEEAKNILEMIALLKEANNNLDDEEVERLYRIEEEGIKNLERREYTKALKAFKEVADKLPNALPARNNLSLSYFYLGDIDKAIELARDVLCYQPFNVHANCNICVYYEKIGAYSLLKKQIRIIKKLNINNEDSAYKIADTFGSIGRDREAYAAYRRLLRYDNQNTSYIHYYGVAAFNCKNYKEALLAWERLKKIDINNYLSDYYSKIVIETEEGIRKFEPLLYIYQLPKEEITYRVKEIYKFLSLSAKESKTLLKESKEIMDLLYFALVFDRYVLKKLIFNKIKSENLGELAPVIRKYILHPEIEKSVKLESIFLLNKLGAKEPYQVYLDGTIEDVTIEAEGLLESEWKKEWDEVKLTALKMMKNCYKTPYKKIVDDIWYDFIKSSFPEVPKIGKTEIWAAALEYAYCKFSCKDVTQQALAEKYGVSRSSLSEKFKIMYRIIGNKFWGIS